VEISDATHFTTLADTLSEPATEGRLREMCDRWIYSTGLIFGLNREEQDRSGFRAQVLPLPLMPTDHIVSLLIAERDKLNRAIEALGAPRSAVGVHQRIQRLSLLPWLCPPWLYPLRPLLVQSAGLAPLPSGKFRLRG